jgi:hypothetical protein
MTTSSAANRTAYALAICIDVIKRYVDPLRKVSRFLFIASKRAEFASLA